MMSESRRNRRTNKRSKPQPKSDISKKDKIIALIVMVLIFIVGAIAAFFYSLYKSGLTLSSIK
jgi:flagellar basal body-associated protein FliL